MFSQAEGFYAGCAKRIKLGEQPANIREFFGLILMMFDLKLRNAAQVNLTGRDNFHAYLMRTQAFKKGILLGWEDRDPTDDDVVDHLIKWWRVRVLAPEAGTEFLTSDNPSVWIASKSPRPKLELVLLPITAVHLAVAFDKRRIKLINGQTTADDQTGMIQMQCRSSLRSVYSSEQLLPNEEALVSKHMKNGKDHLGVTNDSGWEADLQALDDDRGFSFIGEAPPLL